MKLAIRSHDLPKGKNKLSQKLKDADIDGVQLVCYKTFEDILYQTGYLNEARAKGISDDLKNNGKQVYLIGAYFNPVHSNKEKVKLGIDVFKEYLKYSQNLGCLTVGSETGSYNDDKWTYNPQNRTDDALQEVVKIFRELCDYASLYNAQIGIEGAFGHVCYDIKTLNKAIKLIDRKNITVIFDLFNYLDINNHIKHLEILREGLEIFDKNIHCFHLKDYVVEGNRLKQVPLGKGIMDYIGLVHIIKEYDNNAILVLEGTTGGNIIPAVKFVKKIWGNN